MTGNEIAFLTMISRSEGTDQYPNPYAVCFGGKHTITDFSDHPAVTGEWLGEPLDSLGPQYHGEFSTAAGRYQIRKVTWLEARDALGLKDFTPASQDAAACGLIKRRRAWGAVQRGDIAQAIALCANEWASLPGNIFGQPQQKLADLIEVFKQSGGQLA